MERNAPLLHDLANFFDGKNHARLVIRIHDRDDCGLVRDSLAQIIQVQPALTVHQKLRDSVSFPAQVRRHVVHRRVLNARSDEMPLLQ